MPEYLAPGVYVEEVSFRAKSIEGVSTSTTGFVGMTRYGPVQYPGGPSSNKPRMVGSFTEFERVFGGLQPFDRGPAHQPYTAYAARAFFENGGKRLYVARVFAPLDDDAIPDPFDLYGVARADIPEAPAPTLWRARWPGSFGNVIVECEAVRSDNVAFRYPVVVGSPVDRNAWGMQVRGATKGAVVEIRQPLGPGEKPARTAPLEEDSLFVILVDPQSGRQTFLPLGTPDAALGQQDAGDGAIAFPNAVDIRIVELTVTVQAGERVDSYPRLTGHPGQRRFVGKVLERDNPESEDAIVWLDTPEGEPDVSAAQLMLSLSRDPSNPLIRRRFTLTGGTDALMIGPADIEGKAADPDDLTRKATGLEALGEIEDISIVAAPDSGALPDPDQIFTATQSVISHAERYRYRIAVVDGPAQSTLTKIREFRGKFDSTYGAIYHPWIEILDPLSRASDGYPQNRILLPPSGFVAGIYARSDIARGVHKAPANEIVRGLTRFEVNINKSRNEVLNPEGVNCLRFFDGSGNRVWGARTMTADQEWKYVNVRRLFIYIEHSIDRATQWAVFEPNNELLWKRIKRMVEEFLFVLWRDGALLGRTPEEAYFVACDRTTMSQNDLDNGRMICLVGVCPVKPAEFVIFRVGQWTADAPI